MAADFYFTLTSEIHNRLWTPHVLVDFEPYETLADLYDLHTRYVQQHGFIVRTRVVTWAATRFVVCKPRLPCTQ
jgi:hypothetical protein